jgi:hypothetical protein
MSHYFLDDRPSLKNKIIKTIVLKIFFREPFKIAQKTAKYAMNIFYLNADPQLCAQQHVDKHVVKMILESAQLLSTAHRLLDGEPVLRLSAQGRQRKYWQLPDERDALLYSATHANHPSAIWVRDNARHYDWLYGLFCALLDEYQFRYEKNHACLKLVQALATPPQHIQQHIFREPTPAMPPEFIIAGDVIRSYHNYYNGAKSRLFAWKKRPIPDWIVLPKTARPKD